MSTIYHRKVFTDTILCNYYFLTIYTVYKQKHRLSSFLSGKTIAQVALRWLLQKDVVPSVIIGATSVKQLEDNVGAASNWQLSKEQVF